MTERFYIKPAPQPDGQDPLKVRKPVNGHLATEGEWVNAESYWLRRLNDGDVVAAEPPAEKPVVPPAADSTAKARSK
jgi:hypothetical protein